MIHDAVNRGLVHRLNQIVDVARGRLLARMDADDLMHPRRIETQMRHFESHPETRILGTAAFVIDEYNVPYGIRGDTREFLEAGIRAGFLHPTVMGRTAWFRENRYDPRYARAEDSELWQRVDSDTACARLAAPLLFYREPLRIDREKYRRSMRTTRQIVRAHGPPSHFSRRKEIGRTYLKEIVLAGLAAVGREDMLIRRRNRACSAAELREAQEILRQLEPAGGCEAAATTGMER